MQKIKKYCEDNVHIKITDFELEDVSFYGCDAWFDFEIIDNETGALLDTDVENVEYAFMGVDDSEDIYFFLEEKGIDFSEEYDDDFDRLPDELKKEFEEYELERYDEMYHEYLFDGDEETMQEYVDKIMEHLYLAPNKFYIVKDEKICWIEATHDYFGVHLHSESVKIHRVYNVDEEGWIYKVDGIYFNVFCGIGMSAFEESAPDTRIEFYERDDKHPYTVTQEDITNGTYWDVNGPVRFEVGDVIYRYYIIDEESEPDK